MTWKVKRIEKKVRARIDQFTLVDGERHQYAEVFDNRRDAKTRAKALNENESERTEEKESPKEAIAPTVLVG